jgi:Na+-driven multidrug efflux pump
VAKIIDSDIDSQSVSKSDPIWQIVLVGIILGVLYWWLTAFLLNFVNLIGVAGDIATILVATIGIVIMLNLRMTRPLLVALASAISLWGLAKLTDGLNWFEIIIWSVLVYSLSYLLFSWLNRYKRVVPILITAIIIVVIVRIIIIL